MRFFYLKFIINLMVSTVNKINTYKDIQREPNYNLGFSSLISYFLIPTIVSIICSQLIKEENTAIAYSIFIGNIIYIFFMFLFFKELRIRVLDFLFATSSKDFKRNFITIIVLILIYYFILGLLNIIMAGIYSGIENSSFSDFFKTSSVNQSTLEEAINSETGFKAFMLFMGVVMLGPLVEEIAFREGLFSMIKNPIIALITSSLVFGFIHIITSLDNLDELYYLPMYIWSGIVFSIIYFSTDYNYIYSTISHVFINLVTYIFVVSI